MTKFLAALVTSGALLSGVVLAATPTPAPTHGAKMVNKTTTRSNTQHNSVFHGTTQTPRPKVGAVNYNSSKSNSGNLRKYIDSTSPNRTSKAPSKPKPTRKP
jgi:hypothetical protein